jgi:hypothetical protein
MKLRREPNTDKLTKRQLQNKLRWLLRDMQTTYKRYERAIHKLESQVGRLQDDESSVNTKEIEQDPAFR